MTTPAAYPSRATSIRHEFDGSSPRAYREVADLPGPKGLPLLGNMLQIQKAKVHLILERWVAEYGKTYVFRMGREPVFAVADPILFEQMLRDRPGGFRRSSKLAGVFTELNMDAVFSAEGEAWRVQRKLAVQALAQRNLRRQFESLVLIAGRLKKRWEKFADSGEPVDLTEEFKRFTVDATTLIAFGYDLNTIEQDGDVVQRKLKLVFPVLNRRIFALIPSWRFVRLPGDRRFERALADLREWLDELVSRARSRLAADPSRGEQPSNFLEAMLVARDEQGLPFSDQLLFANLMTMLVAGEDTTAYTLGWAVHELCESPEAVELLQLEADQILGATALAADPTIAQKLIWAGAIADETMRLRPVAPVMFTNALKDTVVGDVRVPRGTKLVILSRPAATDPANFHDPGAFRPKRWLGGCPAPHNVGASIPFGSGPRICPGRSLALLEMKLLLSMLYKNFHVSRFGPAANVREIFSFTMMPSSVEVRLRRR